MLFIKILYILQTYGAVIGALSQNFKPFISKPLEIALGLTKASPWKPVSQTILQYTTELKRFDVKEYSKDEAKAVMDYYYETSILPRKYITISIGSHSNNYSNYCETKLICYLFRIKGTTLC